MASACLCCIIAGTLIVWESAKVSHKRVLALLTPEKYSYEMAQMLQKPVFALPGLSADECENPFV